VTIRLGKKTIKTVLFTSLTHNFTHSIVCNRLLSSQGKWVQIS